MTRTPGEDDLLIRQRSERSLPTPGLRGLNAMAGAVGDAAGAERVVNLIARARRLSSRLPGGWDRRARDLGKVLVNYRGARQSFGRRTLFSLLGRGSDLLLAPFGDARLLVPADDQELGRVVFATGGYERVYMATALDELARLGFPFAGTTFVDVGANIGTSTIDALVHFGFGRAVCFEPDERSYRVLRANLAINDLDARAQTFAAALSDRDGDAHLETSATNFADNRLVSGSATEGPTVTVACRRLDTIVDDGAVTLDEIGLLWLDVQGHEAAALRGASRALAAGIPLVMEYTPAALAANRALGDLEALVAEHYTTVIDLHPLAAGLRSRAELPAGDMAALRDRYRGDDHTDLLVVRGGRG